MSIANMMNSEYFNIFFSIILGIGIVSIFKPMCTGPECSDTKAPPSKDFNGNVFKFGEKCHEFNTEIVECPSSGAIEAFRELDISYKDVISKNQFTRRASPITRCE